MNIKDVVNDPEWQELRQSFVGTWKTRRVENCQKLLEYLGDLSDPLKLRRVHNYLTGTGFRLGVIRGKEIDQLLTKVKQNENV